MFNDPDPDPTTFESGPTLRDAMVSMHEMFLSSMAAGFTEEQALRMIVLFMRSQAEE